MATLREAIADRERRRRVVDDGVRMIEDEVHDKHGLTGLAVRAAFKTVTSLRPGFVGMALDHLLDEFAGQVDPTWSRCQEGRHDPRAFFVQNGTAVANALLSITDARAQRASGPVRKAYDTLRPRAMEHVVAAMPRLAALVAKHAR